MHKYTSFSRYTTQNLLVIRCAVRAIRFFINIWFQYKSDALFMGSMTAQYFIGDMDWGGGGRKRKSVGHIYPVPCLDFEI